MFGVFILMSFRFSTAPSTKYELVLEAKGCHYQISVNGELLDDGKTYQKIDKIIDLNKKISESGEQKIDIKMLRISREMTLKSTNAFLNLRLEKRENDSVILIKEVKLPTFPYNEDEEQPQSIGSSIEFNVEN